MTFPSVTRNTESAPFFDAAARQTLLARQCSCCGHLRAARRRTCRRCGDAQASWLPVSGAATLVTWARHPMRDGIGGSGLFGMVELDEGPWMEAILVDVDDDHLRAGLRLQAQFVSGEDGDVYPVFGVAATEATEARR